MKSVQLPAPDPVSAGIFCPAQPSPAAPQAAWLTALLTPKHRDVWATQQDASLDITLHRSSRHTGCVAVHWTEPTGAPHLLLFSPPSSEGVRHSMTTPPDMAWGKVTRWARLEEEAQGCSLPGSGELPTPGSTGETLSRSGESDSRGGRHSGQPLPALSRRPARSPRPLQPIHLPEHSVPTHSQFLLGLKV